VFPFIKDREILVQALDYYLKLIIPTVEQYIQNGPPVLQGDQKASGTTDRVKDIRISDRKKIMKQSMLYENVDVKDLAIKSIQVIILLVI
jgi:hypothetical protein